ncbi:MAG: cysteine peptidase family C39 domain-containing protein, partial [Fibrobacteraceae bacterium]|nr:cysteine peptidase family C39 domain-containing protein [Fibrobacteraceae bacterium]
MNNFFYILKALGVECSYSYAKDRFLAQERNHTLWGIKKLLEHYGVQVTAVKSEAKSLSDVTYPFVCQLPKEGAVAIVRMPENPEVFLEQWNGVALLCDASRAKEPHYLWHKLK